MNQFITYILPTVIFGGLFCAVPFALVLLAQWNAHRKTRTGKTMIMKRDDAPEPYDAGQTVEDGRIIVANWHRRYGPGYLAPAP